jgi:hypothetical protein
MRTGLGWGFSIFAVLAACRVEPAPPGEAETTSREGQGGGSAEAAPATPGATKARAGAPTTAEPSASAGAAGEPSAETTSGECGAQRVTLEQLHAGRVRAGVSVSVGPLVASSQKFLVSEAKSGSCLWGAFAAGQGLHGAGSGVFLASFGTPHADGEACVAGTDGLPDDLKIGDVLEAAGKLDEYVPATCSSIAPVQQLMIDAACPPSRSGTTAEPEPELIDAAFANRLAAGKDPELLRQWSGALVQLEDVTAQQDEDGDAVFPFGAVRLAETSLEVHSRLYYFDLSQGGPKASSKAPHYPYPTAFTSVTGLVFLDYCSWVLAPRDRCADLAPPSSGCAGSAVGP